MREKIETNKGKGRETKPAWTRTFLEDESSMSSMSSCEEQTPSHHSSPEEDSKEECESDFKDSSDEGSSSDDEEWTSDEDEEETDCPMFPVLGEYWRKCLPDESSDDDDDDEDSEEFESDACVICPPHSSPVISTFIGIYGESKAEIYNSLSSFHSIDSDLKKAMELYIMVDGNRLGFPLTKPTVALLELLGVKQKNLSRFELFDYARGDYHGVKFCVYIKTKAKRGKRISHVLMKDLLHFRSQVYGYKPEALLFMDADTHAEEGAIQKLWDALMDDPRCGATTGMLLPANASLLSPITCVQYAEYALGQSLLKTGANVFGCVDVMPGAFSLFRYSCVCIKGVKEEYCSLTLKGEVKTNNLLTLGEDRYLTTLVLMHKYHTKYVHTALANTHVPDCVKDITIQRRRWFNSTVVNQMELIFNTGVYWRSKNWLLGLLTVFDLLLLCSAMSVFCLLLAFAWNSSPYLADQPAITLVCPVFAWLLVFSYSAIDRPAAQILNWWTVVNLIVVTLLYLWGVISLVVALAIRSHEFYEKVFMTIWVAFLFAVFLFSAVPLSRPFEYLFYSLIGFLIGLLFFFPLFTIFIPILSVANLDDFSWALREAQFLKKTAGKEETEAGKEGGEGKEGKEEGSEELKQVDEGEREGGQKDLVEVEMESGELAEVSQGKGLLEELTGKRKRRKESKKERKRRKEEERKRKEEKRKRKEEEDEKLSTRRTPTPLPEYEQYAFLYSVQQCVRPDILELEGIGSELAYKRASVIKLTCLSIHFLWNLFAYILLTKLKFSFSLPQVTFTILLGLRVFLSFLYVLSCGVKAVFSRKRKRQKFSRLRSLA